MTIALTVYGQLVFKWQLGSQEMPETSAQKAFFLLQQFWNPWILTGFAAAFLAALFWMAAMTKLPISRAYPLMSVAFVAVTIASAFLLDEPIAPTKLAGVLLLIPSLALVTK
ncbi:MAG: EamA family transporter [Rubripirellula sp.]|nr:EamA family transporter [Rubripirellula sp.]